MFSSLRSRLWLSYSLLIVAALAVVAAGLFFFLLRNPLLYRQTTERLRAIQQVVIERGENGEARSLEASATRAARTFNVRILLFSQERQLLWDTQGGQAASLTFPVQFIDVTSRLPVVRDEQGRAWLYTIDHLSDGTYLMTVSPRPRVSTLSVFTDDFMPIFLRSGLIALFLSLFLAFVFARWIADPLQKVIAAAREFPSAGVKAVEVQGPHEVRELMRAFNAMVARTQASQRSQREFVANVSHELKTPLTSIQGFSQAILDETAGTPDQRRQAAQVIYDEAARMHRMVLDLLDLARLDAGTADMTISPVDIKALLNAIVERFTPQSQQTGVGITVEADNVPQFMGDGDRLSQVFTNLVDNALKFTPEGGVIQLRATKMGYEIVVVVKDSGEGIASDVLPHIFERFYQADPSRQGGARHGAGLGLAIAYEIVQAHGGRISVRSLAGQGTEFMVYLPLAR